MHLPPLQGEHPGQGVQASATRASESLHYEKAIVESRMTKEGQSFILGNLESLKNFLSDLKG